MKTSATSSQNPSKSPKAYATQATNCSVPESPKPGDENYISQVFHFTQVENRETKRKFASPTIDKLSYADVASSPPRKNPRLSSPALNINSNAMFPSLLFSSLSMLGSKKHTKQAAGTEGAAKSKETHPGLTNIGTKASKSFLSLPTKSFKGPFLGRRCGILLLQRYPRQSKTRNSSQKNLQTTSLHTEPSIEAYLTKK